MLNQKTTKNPINKIPILWTASFWIASLFVLLELILIITGFIVIFIAPEITLFMWITAGILWGIGGIGLLITPPATIISAIIVESKIRKTLRSENKQIEYKQDTTKNQLNAANIKQEPETKSIAEFEEGCNEVNRINDVYSILEHCMHTHNMGTIFPNQPPPPREPERMSSTNNLDKTIYPNDPSKKNENIILSNPSTTGSSSTCLAPSTIVDVISTQELIASSRAKDEEDCEKMLEEKLTELGLLEKEMNTQIVYVPSPSANQSGTQESNVEQLKKLLAMKEKENADLKGENSKFESIAKETLSEYEKVHNLYTQANEQLEKMRGHIKPSTTPNTNKPPAPTTKPSPSSSATHFSSKPAKNGSNSSKIQSPPSSTKNTASQQSPGRRKAPEPRSSKHTTPSKYNT